MVATWNRAAPVAYYRGQAEYYLGGVEPAGRWFAPGRDFGVEDAAVVDNDVFERLYCGLNINGRRLVRDRSGPDRQRILAYDYTFSAPKSVAIAWAFAQPDLRQRIEHAQDRAVRAAMATLEREASFARRGRNGARIEPVHLTAALFQHGESRPVKHADDRLFGDPNLHTHAVIVNVATRADHTVGALHSVVLRDWKMAAGAAYHAALAVELSEIGFAIDRIGKNGTFELAGVDAPLIDYFSARRREEIETALAEHGVTSANASALAAAIAKATRGGKQEQKSRRRDDIWREAAQSRGVAVAEFSQSLIADAQAMTREAGETLLVERLGALPGQLTETESVVDRRSLLRAVAVALVGTGLPSERVDQEVDRLIETGAVVEIGRDAIGLPRYSTPEMIRVEREAVACAKRLAARECFALDKDAVRQRCLAAKLSAEQTEAALAATQGGAVALAEGAPGSGKSTMLRPIADAYKAAGYEVIGAAAAWRVANTLGIDLAIKSRATASWLETAKNGHAFLNRRSVLVVDEAGLIGSRDVLGLLRHVEEAGAKILLVGDRLQLQAIAAGSGLSLVARAVEAARVDAIVRQHDVWAREAIRALGNGKARDAIDAFATRGRITEADGAKAAIDVVVERWKTARANGAEPLILARTNAQIGEISRAVRHHLRAQGEIVGPEVVLNATTPSGHPTTIAVAVGDRVRFLARNDEIGVFNGVTATVLHVEHDAVATDCAHGAVRLHVDISGRRVVFDPQVLADDRGRIQLGWAYASTVYGAQGVTVDHAVVLLDPSFDRHSAYVAASRARIATEFVVDAKAIDRQIAANLPVDLQHHDAEVSADERRAWLAARLCRAHIKETTLDAVTLATNQRKAEVPEPTPGSRQIDHSRSRELSLE